MSIDQIERVEGQVMPVNTFLIRAPGGVVVIDGMLTVSDAARVRQAIDDTGLPVAGVVVTHPHPDHYAGLAHLVDADDVAIVATSAVDAMIRRDDQLKNEVVGLDRLESDLPDDVTLFVGHGSPGGKELLTAQRRYIETFVGAVEAHADAIDHGDHRAVTETMQRLLPTDALLFLMDLSIEPTLAALRQGGWSS